MIICKSIILAEISTDFNPLLERSLIIMFGIGIDFIMVALLGLSEDWHFYVAIFAIGICVSFNSLKYK